METPNCCTQSMDSSLYKIIISGETDHLKQIIASSSSSSSTNGDDYLLQMITVPLKNTALHIAVKSNNISCVEEIYIRCPSLITQQNIKGDTPLHIASRLGLYDIASFLIHQYSKINQETDIESSNGETKSGVVVYESLPVLDQQKQVLVRMRNNENDTALHEAVRNHRFEIVKLLTEADPSYEYFPNNAGETPLYLAAEDGLLPFVVRIIQMCQSSGHDHGPHSRTPLHIAVISNSSDAITKFLVENKPGIVREEDEYGCNALHYAAFYGDIEKVGQLLKADPTVACMSDKDGKTALHIAASSTSENRIEVVKELTRHSPDSWELLDNKGRNFLHAAAENGVYDVIKYVLDLKKSMGDYLLNEPDNNGNTPLHLASMFRNIQAVGILCRDNRVNKSAKNKDSLTALDLLHDNLVNDDDNLFIMDAYNNLKKAGAVRSCRKQSIRTELDKRKERIKEELDKQKQSIKEELDKQKDRRIKEELDKRNRRRKHFEEMEKERQTRLLVATLIATVTFAAGFTLPGGYNSDNGPYKGMAVLTRKPAFIVFVASNTIAMLLSTFTVFIHFWFRQGFSTEEDDELSLLCMSMEYHCTFGAIIAMEVAFVTGAFAVLFHPPGLAIPICVLGCSFFLLCGFLLYESYKLRGIVVFGYLYRPGRNRVKS